MWNAGRGCGAVVGEGVLQVEREGQRQEEGGLAGNLRGVIEIDDLLLTLESGRGAGSGSGLGQATSAPRVD